MSKIQRELLQNNKKERKLNCKIDKDLNKYFTKEDI